MNWDEINNEYDALINTLKQWNKSTDFDPIMSSVKLEANNLPDIINEIIEYGDIDLDKYEEAPTQEELLQGIAIFYFPDADAYIYMPTNIHKYSGKVTTVTRDNYESAIGDYIDAEYIGLAPGQMIDIDDKIGDKFSVYENIDINNRTDAFAYINGKFYFESTHAQCINDFFDDIEHESLDNQFYRPNMNKVLDDDSIDSLILGNLVGDVAFIETTYMIGITPKDIIDDLKTAVMDDIGQELKKIYIVDSNNNTTRIAKSLK